jgi:RimJ/RimL family protein N-acetyltransferase
MVSDGVIHIEDTRADELPSIHRMEQESDTAKYIIPYSLKQHKSEYAQENVFYKSIFRSPRKMIGFAILASRDNATSLEFRRLVICEKGKGFGTRAVALMDTVAREEFKCSRIWLDVFEFNSRGQHIYRKQGYEFRNRTESEGIALCVYDKQLDL